MEFFNSELSSFGFNSEIKNFQICLTPIQSKLKVKDIKMSFFKF